MSHLGLKLLKCYLTFISRNLSLAGDPKSSHRCQIFSFSCSCFLQKSAYRGVENLHHHLSGQRRWPADIWFPLYFPSREKWDGWRLCWAAKWADHSLTREGKYICVCSACVVTWRFLFFFGGGKLLAKTISCEAYRAVGPLMQKSTH